MKILPRDPYEDPDLYDRVEADIELQGRRSIEDEYPFETDEDTHIESCTNCGAYHSRMTFRCSACEAL